ncbi:MAG: amino acid permease, partial [Pedobacter sp.]
VLVCAGVLVLQNRPDVQRGKFKIPYVNSKFIVPIGLIAGLIFAFTQYGKETKAFFFNSPKTVQTVNFVTSLSGDELRIVKEEIINNAKPQIILSDKVDAESYLSNLPADKYQQFISASKVSIEKKYESGWSLFKHKIPMWIFIFICITISFYCVTKNLSLIPVLGLISCLYMMCELGISNWIGFGIWLVIGLVVYFAYGFRHSKLAKENA